MAKHGPKVGPRPFYFGRRVCAICLGYGARSIRYMETILVEDKEIAGGSQYVHKNCWRGLLESDRFHQTPGSQAHGSATTEGRRDARTSAASL